MPYPAANAQSLAFCPAVKQRAYTGVSQHVARHLLVDVQPPLLALLAHQLLHLLRAHEAAAAFQAAALELVRAHSGGKQGGAAGMPTHKASVLVVEASMGLQALAELLAKPLPDSRHSPHGSAADPPRPGSAAGPADALPPLLDAVAARRLLQLVAAVLHVPALHRAALEAELPSGTAAQQAAVIETGLAEQLGRGARALLAVLASSSSGRHLLLADAGVLEQLLLATDAGCLAAGWQAAAGSAGASLLQHLLVSEAAVAQLCSATLDSEAFAVASQTAAALLHEHGAGGRLALVQALALRARAAVPRLLLMLRMHCALLRAACGTGAATAMASAQPQASQLFEPDFALLLAAAPACAPVAQLLLALLGSTHPGVLACWQQHAVSVQIAVGAELRLLGALPPTAAGVVGGLGAACSALASIKGAVAAVMTVQQEQGLASLLTFLAMELPPLVAPRPAAEAGAGGRRAGVRSVQWDAVELLFW